MPRGDRTRAAAVAAGRDGVVTCAQLHAAEISPRLAAREVVAGRWTRAAREVYLPHPPPVSHEALVRAALAYVGPRCVVTGVLVLAELGLRWLPKVAGIHVLVPEDVRVRSSGLIRVTRTTAFAELQTWIRYGVPFAAPERAVVDAARAAADLREARGIVLGAVADCWAEPVGLRRLLDATQRNGSALARRAVLDAERGCASPPEAELVDAMLGRGERFLVNPELRVHGVLLGYPDVWLLGCNVGGEVESGERHGTAEQQESTYDRHERFGDQGVPLVHLGVSRVRRDAAAAAAYLLRRGAELACPLPPGLVVTPRGPELR